MRNQKYCSDVLVHWTGRKSKNNIDEAFEILRKICENQSLKLSYCPNYVSDELQPLSSMACFTDVPLRYSKEHCSKFGKVGIGFKKKNMIQYGANPVFYTTNKHFTRVNRLSDLCQKMLELEKDREWMQDFVKYHFTEEETLALHEVLEYLQEYSYKGQDYNQYVTYYQREWRLTSRIFNTVIGEPKAGEVTIAGSQDGKPVFCFTFSEEDVYCIITPIRYYFKALKLSSLLGCKVVVYELSVLLPWIIGI